MNHLNIQLCQYCQELSEESPSRHYDLNPKNIKRGVLDSLENLAEICVFGSQASTKKIYSIFLVYPTFEGDFLCFHGFFEKIDFL